MGRPYKKPQITCPYPASSGQIPESWSAADGFLQRSPTRICGLCSNQSTFIACFNAGETQGNLAAVFGLGRALYKISPRLLQFIFFLYGNLYWKFHCARARKGHHCPFTKGRDGTEPRRTWEMEHCCTMQTAYRKQCTSLCMRETCTPASIYKSAFILGRIPSNYELI